MRSSFDADNVSAVILSLQHAGIAVYSDDMSQPVVAAAALGSPGTQMLAAQGRGMAIELSNGGGFTGELLNSLTPPLPLEDGTLIPVSQLLSRLYPPGRHLWGETIPGAAARSRSRQTSRDPVPDSHHRLLYEGICGAAAGRRTQNPEVINLALAGNARLSASFRSISVTDDPCGAVGEFLDDLAPSLAEAVQDLINPDRSSSFFEFCLFHLRQHCADDHGWDQESAPTQSFFQRLAGMW